MAGKAEEQRALCAVIRKDVADLREVCSEFCEIGNFMVLREEVQALSEQERSGEELELALRHFTFEAMEFSMRAQRERNESVSTAVICRSSSWRRGARTSVSRRRRW